MDKHIKIYKRDGKYCFTINQFSSLHHSSLTKFAQPEYRYAWEAQRDARKIADNHFYHIEALEKFAIEDLSKPVIEDVSAERKIADHYEEIYDGLVDVASGMDEEDKNQKKINYFEAKAVVQEILFVIEKMPEDELSDEKEKEESEKRLKKVISKIKDLVHEHYMDELKKDEKESKEKTEDSPMGGMEDMGMPPMEDMGMPPMEDMGMPMASSKSFIKTAQSDVDDETIDELFKEYGERACSAIENKHPNATWIKESNGVDIRDGDRVIIEIDVGDDFFVENIRPGEKIDKMYPFHSLEFYQAYWKPIVERIGHCCVGDNDSILHLGDKCLPDIPKEFPYESEDFSTISKESKFPKTFTVSFNGEKPSWFINPSSISKTASAKYSKEDYYKNGKGAIVVCTDPTLPSYFKNTGHVVQVVPFGEHLEIDINFGNHICRMVEDQFDIIDEL